MSNKALDAIQAAVNEVEALPSHLLLTDAVVLLGQARGKVLEWQSTPQQPAARMTGFYALQTGDPDVEDNPKREISEAKLRLAKVNGLVIRMRGSFISKNGAWDFSFVDRNIAKCKRVGKPYVLLLMSGPRNPLSEASLNFYEKAIGVLGARYSNDPLCVGVHMTGATPEGAPGELHWDEITPAVMAANKRMLKAWAVSFPKQTIVLSGSGKDVEGLLDLGAYGIIVAPGRLMCAHHALKQSTSLDANHNEFVMRAVRELGADQGYQMACPAGNELRFGPGGIMAGVEQGYLAADRVRNPRSKVYFEIYPGDLEDLR